jgi:hypothetical protein
VALPNRSIWLTALIKAPRRRKEIMTVAIGMFGIGGLFVCADSHVIASDGIVTSGYKLGGVEWRNGSYVIANASDDGNAANMVANEILAALGQDSTDRWNIEPAIKKTMKEWHSGYTQGEPPSMQFILASRTGMQNRGLYFCEPPNTVLRKHIDETIVIGLGAQVVEPLVSQVVLGPLSIREALIRAAYLMYRAKKEHVYLKGSQTDALVISEATGDILQVGREEMAEAEALGPDVDFMLRYCYLGLLGQPQGVGQKDFLKGMNKKYLEARKKADAIRFSFLTEPQPRAI